MTATTNSIVQKVARAHKLLMECTLDIRAIHPALTSTAEYKQLAQINGQIKELMLALNRMKL